MADPVAAPIPAPSAPAAAHAPEAHHPPVATTPKKRGVNKWLMVGIMLALVLMVVGVLVFALSRTSPPSTPQTATPGATSPQAVQPAETGERIPLMASFDRWSREISGIPGTCLTWSLDPRVRVETLGPDGSWAPPISGRPDYSVRFKRNQPGEDVQVFASRGRRPNQNGSCF